MKRISRPETTIRSCLKCSKDFRSKGASNRLCEHCNKKNSEAHYPKIYTNPSSLPFSQFDASIIDVPLTDKKASPKGTTPIIKEESSAKKKLSWKEENQRRAYRRNRVGPGTTIPDVLDESLPEQPSSDSTTLPP